MKLDYVEMSGFRGYSTPVRVNFGSGFTIIDGRNGVGKSSIFDAVEFALLGRLNKYEGATADRESAQDYIWWRGDGISPQDRYVQVGFSNNEQVISIHRSMLENPSEEAIDRISNELIFPDAAPGESLHQLLRNSIIRDEHIAALSLDLKETERYQVLRDAIGALGSDFWVERAARLVSEAQRRVRVAESEVQAALSSLNSATTRINDLVANLLPQNAVAQSTSELRRLLNTDAGESDLIRQARDRVAQDRVQVERLLAATVAVTGLQPREARLREIQATVAELRSQLQGLTQEEQTARKALEASEATRESERLAADLAELITLGRMVGLQELHCPLCSAAHSPHTFEEGVKQAEEHIGRLREAALRHAELERNHRQTAHAVEQAERQLADAVQNAATIEAQIRRVRDELITLGLSAEADRETIARSRTQIERASAEVAQHLAVMETLSLTGARAAASQAMEDAKARHVRAQERLGTAHRAESRAKALHDAARRAAGDTLDGRLNQILPLTSELYQRLRPHPVWDDISYKLRGDVKRFLKLQVGEDLNPQFIFSSGQRRATGLAFLLSVYLSISWSKLNTLMLDDPVQHIDDFRSVHLAEVLSKLVTTGKQIICAAEDVALADLIGRRLPVRNIGEGKRVTLGVNHDGRLAVLSERVVTPMPQGTFLPEQLKTTG